MTAGDAGKVDPPDYWKGRENGIRAAYAALAGVSNVWTESDAGVAGRSISKFTLSGRPNVSLVFLRLPDGGIDGGGFGANGSLQMLWEGSRSSLTTVDGAATYTRQGVVDALAAIMTSVRPSRINTQDYAGQYGNGDHSDHLSTGYFTRLAHRLYATPHTLYGYLGYTTTDLAENVSGADFDAKANAFLTYARSDPDVCQTLANCNAGLFGTWFTREYVSASEQGGDHCLNIDGIQTVVPNNYKSVGRVCIQIPQVCQSVVSDTTDTTDGGASAVATFVSNNWTAGANIPGATWIFNAFHVADPVNGETVTFTKNFNITGTPTAASIVIASDDTFRASLNGTAFGSSSALDNYSAGNERTFDISSLVRTGSNSLIITVQNIGTGDTDPELNPAGLRYKLDIQKASCADVSRFRRPTPPPFRQTMRTAPLSRAD